MFRFSSAKISDDLLTDENRNIFREKVKFWKFSPESENLSKIVGTLKQREMHHGLRGDGRLSMELPKSTLVPVSAWT